MKRYLIAVAVGPVQDFIAAARKLRDLWFGSHVLSELSKRVALSLLEQNARLVFPAVDDASELQRGSPLIAANKILAVWEGDEEPRQVVNQAREAWRGLLHELGEDTLVTIGTRFSQLRVNKELFQRQLSDCGEFYGVWVAFGAQGYAAARRSAENLLAARKNLRTFEAPSWAGYGVPKNSLDGMRETVVDTRRGGAPEIPGLLKKGERLDAIGCVKRFEPLRDRRETPHFDDLADVAVAPWLQRVRATPEHAEMLRGFHSCFERQRNLTGRGGDPLSELYFADRARLCELFDEEDAAERAAAALARLTSGKNAGQPGRYACIMAGDGDAMGALIDRIPDEEGHREFSRALLGLAEDARLAVERAQGSLVYAGGDDVLAYLPLNSALEACNGIRQAFVARMAALLSKLGVDGPVPTFSIGLAIVHYSEPLGAALALARSAERAAKHRGGRNALAITQHKRSGSDIEVVGRWDDQNGAPGITRRLGAMIDLYRTTEGTLSARLAYQLRRAGQEAGDVLCYETDQNSKQVPRNASSAMVLQILGQKNDPAKLGRVLHGQTSIRRLSDELIVAKQFAAAS